MENVLKRAQICERSDKYLKEIIFKLMFELKFKINEISFLLSIFIFYSKKKKKEKK